jgi:hypothetical protein
MVFNHVLTHSLLFALIVNGSLLMVMITTSPRVWGYADYSQAIKDKVPPQTAGEKRLAWIFGLPWMIFTLGFPVVSTYVLKSNLGGELSFWTAFLNVFVMVSLAMIGDLVLLDWLIVNKITPKFVIIPGTEKSDYKDFSHHFRAHARAAILLVVLSFIYAGIVWFF